MTSTFDHRTTLRFVRHGATAANLLGLRCGGDLDLALVETGRAQALKVARRIAALVPPVRLIVTSGLRRTRETAHIIAHALGRAVVVVELDFAERSLGEWNLRSIAGTQAWLARGLTPPGGEASAAFVERVTCAARRLTEWLPESPLLVSSKGVARVLGELCGLPRPPDLDNGALAEFELAVRPRVATARGAQ
jgi:broad specificity phosphatase PhoE